MKTNENAKNIIIVIGSLIIAVWTGIVAYLVGKEIGKWGCQTIKVFAEWIEKIFNKNKLNTLKPFLKEAIKKADHVSLDELEKKSTTKEVVDEDQVPNNIKEKIESDEEATKASGTKTIINGKIYDNRDQLIYELRKLKRSKIGSHRVEHENSVWSDDDLAKKIKIKMNKMLEEAKKKSTFSRLDAILLTDNFIVELNSYIEFFKVDTTEIDFPEKDNLINKFFPREV